MEHYESHLRKKLGKVSSETLRKDKEAKSKAIYKKIEEKRKDIKDRKEKY